MMQDPTQMKTEEVQAAQRQDRLGPGTEWVTLFAGLLCLAVLAAMLTKPAPLHAKKPAPPRTATTSAKVSWTPTSLSKAKRRQVYRTREDVLYKKVCEGPKHRVTLKCRDQVHYTHTNEYFHQVYYRYVNGIGGIHVGVGTDQNFTFIAWARSRYAFLTDYDPVAVWMNLVNRALVMTSPTQRSFLLKLRPGKNLKRVERILRRFYGKRKDINQIIQTYHTSRLGLRWHYHLVRKYRKDRRGKDDRVFSWLHRDKDYQYIRQMFKTGRIRIMKGDLLGTRSHRGIGKLSHKLGIPVRSFYMSNAEEFWKYPTSFRKNVRSFKMDGKSVVIRTRHSSKFGPKLDEWIYILQPGLSFQRCLAKSACNKVDWMMRKFKRKRPEKGLHLLDF